MSEPDNTYMIRAAWEVDGKKYHHYTPLFDVIYDKFENKLSDNLIYGEKVIRSSIKSPLDFSQIPENATFELVRSKDDPRLKFDWSAVTVKPKKQNPNHVRDNKKRFIVKDGWKNKNDENTL